MASGALATVARSSDKKDRRKILTDLYNKKAALQRDVTLVEIEIAETIAAWTPEIGSDGQATTPTQTAARRSAPPPVAGRKGLTNIGRITGTDFGARQPPAANEKSLDHFVFDILLKRKLVLAGIVEAVMRAGFKSNATKFRNSVSQALLRLKSVKAITQDKKTKEYAAVQGLPWNKVQDRLSTRSKELRQQRAAN